MATEIDRHRGMTGGGEATCHSVPEPRVGGKAVNQEKRRGLRTVGRGPAKDPQLEPIRNLDSLVARFDVRTHFILRSSPSYSARQVWPQDEPLRRWDGGSATE